MGFPGNLAGKEATCSAGDLGSNPGLGRSPGGGMATHSSFLAWRSPVDFSRSLVGYSSRGCKESDMTTAHVNVRALCQLTFNWVNISQFYRLRKLKFAWFMIMWVGWMILWCGLIWVNPMGFVMRHSQLKGQLVNGWSRLTSQIVLAIGRLSAKAPGVIQLWRLSLFGRVACPFAQVSVSFSETRAHNAHTFYKSPLTVRLLMIHWSKPATPPTHIKRMLNQTPSLDGKEQICSHF